MRLVSFSSNAEVDLGKKVSIALDRAEVTEVARRGSGRSAQEFTRSTYDRQPERRLERPPERKGLVNPDAHADGSLGFGKDLGRSLEGSCVSRGARRSFHRGSLTPTLESSRVSALMSAI